MPREVPSFLLADRCDGFPPRLRSERAIRGEGAGLDGVRVGAVGNRLQEEAKIGVEFRHDTDRSDGRGADLH